MLTADSVYEIAKALSKEELKQLYNRISEDLNKHYLDKINQKNTNLLTTVEVDEMLLKRIFKIEIN